MLTTTFYSILLTVSLFHAAKCDLKSGLYFGSATQMPTKGKPQATPSAVVVHGIHFLSRLLFIYFRIQIFSYSANFVVTVWPGCTENR